MEKISINNNWKFYNKNTSIYLFNLVTSKQLEIIDDIDTSLFVLNSIKEGISKEKLFLQFKNHFPVLEKKWLNKSLEVLKYWGVISKYRAKPKSLTDEYLNGLDRQLDFLEEIFSREGKYIKQLQLKNSKIAILGLGSVAQYIILALEASGIGNFKCIDFDLIEICITPNNFSVLSVIAIIYNEKKQIPYASFGMAAGLSVENVVIKSLEEALMVCNTLEILKNEKKIKKICKTDIQNYIDHAIYYSLPSRKKMWQFFLDGPVISARSVNLNFCANDSNKKLINFFRKNNQEVIFVNLTTKLIKEMGFYCVKIIIPSLHPMDFNYKTRFLRGLKKSSLRSKINVLNNDLHPFA